MILLRGTIRLLRPLTRQAAQSERWDRTILRSLASCAKSVSNYRVPQIEQCRNFSESSTNIVRSPYPDEEVPEVLVTDFFWKTVDKWSGLTALVCGLTGRETNYNELKLLSRRFATSLLQKGFKPGDVIALILPNMPEFPIVALGILEAGMVITTINPLYTADEIVYQLKNSEAAAIVTIPENLEKILKVKSILEKENKELGSKLRIVCTNGILGNDLDVPNNVDRYTRFVDDGVDDTVLPSLQTPKRTTHDIAIIPYSSGTTGIPKGVCLTHRNLIATIMAMYRVRDLEDASSGEQQVVPAVLPFFHIYGFTIVLLQSLYFGTKIITMPKFEENLFLNVLKKYKCSVLYVAPPLVLYLGSSPNVTKEYLQSVRIIISGAAPVTESDIMKCVKKSPPAAMYKQGYGLTETSPTVCIMEKGRRKYDSVGDPTVNTILKVADLQTAKALGPYEEGEICVKGPQVMKGYLNNPKANAEVFDAEGWFHTGDIGYYDKEKHFYITDRLKELIKVKGFQVAPAELEALLRSHPQVEDAGVIGIPDPSKGETPIGFVKLKKDAKVNSEELSEFLAPKITSYKKIHKFVFVESIPKSISGKILRKDLKANYFKNLDHQGHLEKTQT